MDIEGGEQFVHKKRTRKKTTYNKINNDVRHKLIYMICEQNIPPKIAAKELGINYSTAKTILRIFRLEKRIKKKNMDDEMEVKCLITNLKQKNSSQKSTVEKLDDSPRFDKAGTPEIELDLQNFALLNSNNVHEFSHYENQLVSLNSNQERVRLFVGILEHCQKKLGNYYSQMMQNQLILNNLIDQTCFMLKEINGKFVQQQLENEIHNFIQGHL